MNGPCPQWQDKIIDYTLAALDARQAETLREHLGECIDCRQYLQSLNTRGESLIKLGAEIGAGMSARQDTVIQALEEVVPAEVPTGRLVPFIGGFLRTAVAAVLILGAGILIGRATGPQPVDVGQLRTDLEASVVAALESVAREDVLAEMEQRLQAGLSANDAKLRIELAEQVRRDLRAFASQFASSSETMMDRRFAEIVQLIEAARLKDRQRVARALQQIRAQTGVGLQSLAALTADASLTTVEN